MKARVWGRGAELILNHKPVVVVVVVVPAGVFGLSLFRVGSPPLLFFCHALNCLGLPTAGLVGDTMLLSRDCSVVEDSASNATALVAPCDNLAGTCTVVLPANITLREGGPAEG